MKRWLGILLAALMLLPLLPARGEEIETIPEEILAWMEAEGIPQEEQEHLLFSLPDGTQQMVWMIWQRDLVVWEKTDRVMVYGHVPGVLAAAESRRSAS